MIEVVIGTRPELIKMAPVLRELLDRDVPHHFIHSNQHYSQEMDAQIIADLGLMQPDYHLDVGSGTHALQTGRIMQRVEEICLKTKPQAMLVHGDTNTTLAGALTAGKMNIKVGHIEAGLRSGDTKMPEEKNRKWVDCNSDLLFAPTNLAEANLLREGIDPDKIIVTGNTVVDALREHLVIAQRSRVHQQYHLRPEEYILLTAHRPETVDTPDRLLKLVKLVDYVQKQLGQMVVFPIHPRTEKQFKAFGVDLPSTVKVIPPVGYLDMLKLLSQSSLVLTDSGGVQEEAYILKRPLMTLRNSTERPETLSANFKVDLDQSLVDQALEAYQVGNVSWDDQAFGDGYASRRIVDQLVSGLNSLD